MTCSIPIVSASAAEVFVLVVARDNSLREKRLKETLQAGRSGGRDIFSCHCGLEIPFLSMKSLSLVGKSVITPVAPRSNAL